MSTTRALYIFAIAFTISLTLGCQSKGPTPKDGAPGVGTAETSGAHPGAAADPHAGLELKQDPHAGMAPGQDPHAGQSPHGAPAGFGKPDSSGMIDVGAVAFSLPPRWEAQQPKSSMRRAQVSAPGSAGAAELIVFFFGPQGAGSADANIERWVGQFTQADGSAISDANKTSGKTGNFEVSKVDVTGRFGGGMGASGQPGAAKSDQRLIGAIVSTPEGPYYFKFLGPSATVATHAAAFDNVIESLVLAP